MIHQVRTLPLLAITFAGFAFGQAFKAPRNWYDQPDLQGIWEVANTKAAADIESAKIIVDPKKPRTDEVVGFPHGHRFVSVLGAAWLLMVLQTCAWV